MSLGMYTTLDASRFDLPRLLLLSYAHKSLSMVLILTF